MSAIRIGRERRRPASEEESELLETHIRYEERQVFEPVQHRLPARALQTIARACQDEPRVCPTTLSS